MCRPIFLYYMKMKLELYLMAVVMFVFCSNAVDKIGYSKRMKTFVSLLNGLYTQGHLDEIDGASALYDLNFLSFRAVDIHIFLPSITFYLELINLRRGVQIQRILVCSELDNGTILIKIMEFVNDEQFPPQNTTAFDLTELTPSDLRSVDGGCEFIYLQAGATEFKGSWPQCLVGFNNNETWFESTLSCKGILLTTPNIEEGPIQLNALMGKYKLPFYVRNPC